jgi:hypothetical protein
MDIHEISVTDSLQQTPCLINRIIDFVDKRLSMVVLRKNSTWCRFIRKGQDKLFEKDAQPVFINIGASIVTKTSDKETVVFYRMVLALTNAVWAFHNTVKNS